MAELEQVLERRDAALKEWRSLSSRSKGAEEAALQRLQELNRLADDVAEEQARTVEEAQRQRVSDVEEALVVAEASAMELRGRVAEERKLLTRLERETSKARRFDPSAKERVDVAERQERELVEWHARHPSTPPPAHLVEAVATERVRLRAEVDAANERLRAESAANLRAAGLDPEDAAAMVGGIGEGRRWKRLRVN